MKKILTTLCLLFSSISSPMYAKTLPVSDFEMFINGYATPENWKMLKGVIQQNVLNTDNELKQYGYKICSNELSKEPTWQLFSGMFSKNVKQHYEQQICDCAMKETLYKATPQDLLKLADPSQREKVLLDYSSHLVSVCSQAFISDDEF